MKKLFCIAFILLQAICLPAQTIDQWYLGEWTNEATTITLMPTLFIFEGDSYGVSYSNDSGRIKIDVTGDDEFIDCDIYADPNTGVLYVYNRKENKTTEYHRTQAVSIEFERLWRSSFEWGYLVLKSENMYRSIRGSGYIYLVLKAYGESCRRGIASIIEYSSIMENGLYDVDEGYLILHDMRSWDSDKEYKNTSYKVLEQFSLINYRQGITIDSQYHGQIIRFKLAPRDEALSLSKDTVFKY